MNIALISEHASPLAILGGTDSGGQNVYVACVAREPGRAGHTVDVFTRRDDPALPRAIDFAPGVRVHPMPAGPALTIPKEGLLPYMAEFGEGIVNHWARSGRPYDVAHANFMSGLAGLRLREVFGVPLVITFHALGKVRRQHRGDDDGFPDAHLPIEEMLFASTDCVIAECPQDREDPITLYGADDRLIVTVPCGVDLAERGPGDGHARERLGLAADEFVVLQLGRLVPRKGIDNVVRVLGVLRARHGVDVHLLVVGGDSAEPDPALTPEIGRPRGRGRPARRSRRADRPPAGRARASGAALRGGRGRRAPGGRLHRRRPRTLRRHRHPHQQRRGGLHRAPRRAHSRPVGPGDRHQPARPLPAHQARGRADAAAGQRPHREHRLPRGQARLAQRQRLPRQPVGAAGLFPRAARRTAPGGHQGHRGDRRRHAHALPVRPLPRHRPAGAADARERRPGGRAGAGPAAGQRDAPLRRPECIAPSLGEAAAAILTAPARGGETACRP